MTVCLAIALCLTVRPQGPPQKLDVYPQQIHLTGPRDEQRLIVLGVWADGRRRDLTRAATFAATATAATVDAAGVVRPVADGNATLTVAAAGARAELPVTVTKSQADTPVSFAAEVEPIITKAGCNSGSCHGSHQGRGGFRLSLFGFDPAFDQAQIVQSNEGRRVVVSDPERSIILAKPSLTMEHGGGERLKLNSREYDRVRRWLADGAPGPSATDPHVTALELFPPARVMVPGEQQQIAVTATWSDGRREDVTPTAQFDALNDAVAAVSKAGLVTAKAAGETHVMIRFGGQAVVARVTLPYATVADYPTPPANNFIDEKLIAKWRDLGLAPSPLAPDDEFLRRLSLDAIGTLPTPEEVRDFLADESPDKRAKAIDKVLGRPEFVDWWALKWGDLLRIDRQELQEKGMWSFHNWVRAQLRDKRPVDEFARDIITAEGSTFTEGPANFYRVGRTAEDWAETTSQVFLGVRMQCAKCHHHPFEKWSQDDYYGLAAFFARLGTKNSQEFGLFGRETVVYLRPTGEARNPRKGAVVKPHPLDGAVMEDEFDRRKKLADWATAPDNPFFARNVVNRFWGYLMGRGLVEPLDDIRATNPASNPELLDALAADFVAHKYDLKHLLRTILSSRAYQLSSQITAGNAADGSNTYFTRYTVKRLTAEQVADAMDFATGTREKYAGVPLGTRAIQLPDTQYRSYLMDTFGRPPRQITCECERTTRPNVAQALHLLNGDFLNKKIADKKGRVEKLVAAKAPTAKAVEELYLATLSRPPSADEAAKAAGWVASAPSAREGLQDLLWALVNSKGFLFNH
ncbi:MAG TPA: DUF1553 domain-containing protein [Fimbriiglobus sp.]|nr:DUF1553 domain-containing protein [Fimbriiglobus sp.]